MNYFCVHFQRTMCRGQRLAVPESQDGNALWEKSEISEIAYTIEMVRKYGIYLPSICTSTWGQPMSVTPIDRYSVKKYVQIPVAYHFTTTGKIVPVDDKFRFLNLISTIYMLCNAP